ncbi:MAG TPA: Calx-beta domain-containing protein, partial [Verrucomicrobiae bacterium]
MRNVCSRVSHFCPQIEGKGAVLAALLFAALFGMAVPSANAQVVTNVLGFAKTTDYAMEGEGVTSLMVVRKEGTHGAIQVEVQLEKDASTNSITGWPTTNVLVTLRDNQLSALVPVTIKDNSNTNVTTTNSFIKFSLVNPRVAPNEDPIFTPVISTTFGKQTINLINDDNATTFTFAKFNYAAPEGSNVVVRVRLPVSPMTAGATGVSVKYKIEEILAADCGPGASTATAGTDFDADEQTLDFGDGDTFKEITIPLKTDNEPEFPEEFMITLSEAKGDPSYSLPSPAFCRVRIINNAFATNAPVAAGSVDRTFNTENVPPFRLRNPGANGPVAAVIVDALNNTYIAGAFSSVNATPRGGIARVDQWGAIDDQLFKPTGANGAVSALQLYTTGPDSGKVLIGGSFNAVNGLPYKGVARLNPDGSADSTFKMGQGADDGPVYSLALEPLGSILIGGAFANVNGISRGGIARLKPNGDVDTASFQGVDINGPVFAILVDPLQVPSVQLSANVTNAVPPLSDMSGTLDAASGVLVLNYDTFDEGDEFQVLLGNTIIYDKVLTNNFTVTQDPNTGQNMTNWVTGKETISLGPVQGTSMDITIRVVPDPNQTSIAYKYDATIDPVGTGSITIAGDFTTVNGIQHGGIARFTPSGVLDTNFTAKIGSGADASVNSLAHQSDGSIIVGGAFERFNNVIRGGITRLLPNGTQDLSFASGVGADQAVHSVVVDDADKIYLGGEFTFFNGTPRNFVARLNSDGTLDTTFMDNALNQFAGFPNVSGLAIDGAQGYVATVAVGPDTNVVVGGLFSQVGGGSTRTEIHPRQNFARLVGGETRGPGNFEITDNTISWDENGGPVPISFGRTGGNLGTARGLITTFDGAAIAGQDYTATNTTYLFAVGKDPTVGATTGAPLNIPIIDDTIIEGNEDFFVDVIGVDGIINLGGEIVRPGVAFGRIPEAQVTIIENDTPQIFLGFAKPEFDVDEDDNVARVEVYRTGDPNQLVTVDYQVRVATGPFAATPGVDFLTATNTITFQPGQTNAFFNVTIRDDEITEPDEIVSLRLSRPNFGAKLDPNATAATLNIIDNDLASGKVDFTSATYVVIEGQPYVDVQVRRAGGNVGLISVDYTTVDGTALNGEDYTKVSGTLTWNNQDISLRTIRIPIVDNGVVEPDEQFSLQLSNPSAPGIIGNLHANPVVTIKDNDFYGDFAFSVADYYADENGANAVIQVIRRNGSADTVSVDYATSAGTAIPGTDYTNVNGTLTFAPGETSKTFVVPIIDDNVADTNRTVNLTLSNPVKATLGAQKTATLTILDNETLDIPAGDVEKDFATGFGANARVNALWLQNDGPTNTTRKIILAGDFTDYDRTPRQHVARVDDDGLVDARYANGLTIDGSVRTILGTSDGKLVIGGDFSRVDDIPASHIARLNATGRRDTLFDIGSGTDGAVNALGQTFIGTNQTSRIIVAGAFTVFNGVSRARIALVGEDAKVDTTFDPGVGPDLAVTAVAAQRDGKIIIGGLFNKISGVPHRGIARLNLDGTVDPSFNPTASVSGTIRSIVIQTDDKILIGGEFNTVNGVVSPGVARLNVDGTLDTSFNVAAGANGAVLSLALQADGKIVVGGDFTLFNNVFRPRINRLLPSGALDLDINFGTGANATIAAVASQYDRKIVIGGDFTVVNGFPRNRFARLFGGSVIGAGRIEFFLSDYLVDEAAGSALLIVKRSGGTESAASVDYYSQPETATPNSDYQDRSGTLTFGPGESVAVITIPILDDNIAEPVETVLVTLTNVVGAAIGRQPIARVGIVSDDAVFSFSQTDYVVNEGITGGQATIKVVREGDLSFPVTVTVTASDGTAVSPDDYTSGSVQLPFTPGETVKTFSIPIVDDNKGEGNETVLLHLST